MTSAGSPPRPFRFGVQLRTAESAGEWAGWARRAEDAGYAVLSTPDHLAGPLGEQFSPLPALAAAADATSRIRLGTWVLGNDFRHPAVLAKEAATLDWLSGGRLELGLGAGWMTEDYAGTGIPRDPPATRIRRLAEAVEVIRGLWGPGEFHFEGEHYRIRGLDGRPKPVQSPPPVQIGGGGERILRLAGGAADTVGLVMRLTGGARDAAAARTATAAATDAKLAWIRDAAGARREPPELNARVLLCAVGEPLSTAAERLGRPLGLEESEILASPHACLGEVGRVCDHLSACRERWGLTYFVVSADSLESFAPVVAQLAGR
ncbi:MAG: TIGR03621 family F420-dependent LLM class oxidoreductase [Proteobacteria bacterium]|nr:TIGR03621 family F420-dependent LLM class oxidoreductase [Pseudomonadota bacterium]